MRVTPEAALDVLALAAQEEADEIKDSVDSGPLGFKWGPPVAK